MYPGRVLAIDYGERRIGLAATDPLRIVASGLGTLTVSGNQEALDRIVALIRDEGVTEIVVGIPLRQDGTLTPKAEKIRAFCEELKKRVSVPVNEWDESYSSVEAQRLLLESESKKRRRRKEKIDELAALVILREYLGLYG